VPLRNCSFNHSLTHSLKIHEQKIAKNRGLGTIAQFCQTKCSKLRHVSTSTQSEKKLLNSNISCTCPHNMFNVGPLTAQIASGVWVPLASLLHRRWSTEVNKTLQDDWPSPGPVHYIYIFGDSCPLTEFFQLENSLCGQVFCSPILLALLHGTRAVGVKDKHSLEIVMCYE